jgi:hypothetical protein
MNQFFFSYLPKKKKIISFNIYTLKKKKKNKKGHHPDLAGAKEPLSALVGRSVQRP